MKEKLLEKLAELEHRACWARYMLDLVSDLYGPDQLARIENKETLEKIYNWERQIKTKYKNLSEEDKEKDRIWARKVLGVIKSK